MGIMTSPTRSGPMVPVTRPTFPITCWSANRIPVSLCLGPLPVTGILPHLGLPVWRVVPRPGGVDGRGPGGLGGRRGARRAWRAAVDTWDPEQYERFAAERSAPFWDLLSLVRPVPGGRVVDLGCGNGELPAALHRGREAAETLGLDSSPAMLERAAALEGGGLRFELGDIAGFDQGAWDVVFSNAALHWLPDHAGLFGRLVTGLNPGGQLAVQMPANHDHPSPVVAAQVAGTEPFRAALDG